MITRTVKALSCSVPFVLHQGGTSSGKTFGILYSLLYHAFTRLKKDDLVSVVAQTIPHLKKGALRDFSRILSMLNIMDKVKVNKTDHTFILPNGVIFEFYAPDDEEKAKSGKRKILFINEANSLKWSVANQLIIRSDVVILDWNPSGKFWLHRMILPTLQESEYVFTRTTYKDNPTISDKIKDEIERLRLRDPNLYSVYGLGIEGKSAEIVFPIYEIVTEFPRVDTIGTGLDFGFTNHPSVAIRTCVVDGCFWADELFYQKGMSNKMIFDYFDTSSKDYGRILADSAEPKSISELAGYGLDIGPVVKGPDSIVYWTEQIKLYPIRITKWSHNLISELDSYKYKLEDGVPTNKPAPNQKDHAIDAKRYGAQVVLTPVDSIKVVARSSNADTFSFGW